LKSCAKCGGFSGNGVIGREFEQIVFEQLSCLFQIIVLTLQLSWWICFHNDRHFDNQEAFCFSLLVET
jgi:hypothetical protein